MRYVVDPPDLALLGVAAGSSDVIVAVIDTGCDIEHPDLKDNYWKNPGESLSVPGGDEDKNEYVDDIYGYDFYGPCINNNEAGCGPTPNITDRNGHGTHVAGIIAAIRDNGIGVSGVAPGVKIMCLKVTPSEGLFYPSTVFKAMDYAYRKGAHIISCSFGPVAKDSYTAEEKKNFVNETNLYEAQLKNLVDRDVLIVAAAGNQFKDLDAVRQAGGAYNPCFMAKPYPKNVLCVAATDGQDKLFKTRTGPGSNFGAETVSVAAPGEEIMSTWPRSFGYAYKNESGTSMAAPVISGIAALVVSILGSKDGNYFKPLRASSLRNYKQGKGTTLVLSAIMYLAEQGLYQFMVSTSADPNDIAVYFGSGKSAPLEKLNEVTVAFVNEEPRGASSQDAYSFAPKIALSRPDVPMKFKVDCRRCSLYVNSLLVRDVYPGLARAAFSNCVNFSSEVAIYDLVVRLELQNINNETLKLTWQPCDDSKPESSVRTHAVNNLLWNPKSEVAGYVPGMQCDLWASDGSMQSGKPPLFKFRYPAALKQTNTGYLDVMNLNTTGDRPSTIRPVMYKLLNESGCAANETAGANCSFAANFIVNVFASGDSETANRTALRSVHNGYHQLLLMQITEVNLYKGTAAAAWPSPATTTAASEAAPALTAIASPGPTVTSPALTSPAVASPAIAIATLASEPTVAARASSSPTPASCSAVPSAALTSSTLTRPAVADTARPKPAVVNPAIAIGAAVTAWASSRNALATPAPSSSTAKNPTVPSAITTGTAITKPAITKPAITKPAITKPAIAKPAKPAITKPAITKPAITKPAITKPAITKPAIAKPAITKPAIAKPAIAKSKSTITCATLTSCAAVTAPTTSLFPVNTSDTYGKINLVLYSGSPFQPSARVASASPGLGLAGSLPAWQSLGAGGAYLHRYVRATGYLQIRTPGTWILRVRDLEGQGVSLVMGDITVRNGVEYPAGIVSATEAVVMLPAGYVPVVVTVRSARADSLAAFDVTLIRPGTREEYPVNGSYWYDSLAG
ncbi:hypothetical protein GPECTOR_13g775 [Gonium pectorale]|uniref:Peptidase S8/S53 domain-containing protein n=1 Tax=Gonium pectorale TaxID=33097 RepID=A0A150GNC9_GONPE|nr:hypothetical protein GPECTOR_13g775 [Gonium pectorale]|eukprot:KXZ51288.1 hypothetical protein GPECTOR_13g775 [Gonium pectorale]